MNIIVFVKQVRTFHFHSENETDSFGSQRNELINNPSDLAALSWAIRLKERYGFTVITVSMGPSAALPLVQELFSYGVDRALLLTSSNLSGSDTYATSYVLGKLVKSLFPEYGLILCGDKSLDGETGQVPHALAMELDIDSVANVTNISFEKGKFSLVCEMDPTWFKLIYKGKLLVSVTRGPEGFLYLPSIRNILDAESKKVEMITCSDFSFSQERGGQKGSFTKVVSLQNKKSTAKRGAETIDFQERKDKLDGFMKRLLGNVL